MEAILSYLKESKTRKLGIPPVTHLEITDKCNFRCVHCQVDRSISQKEMTYSEIRSVLDQLADLGSLFLIISGGEPLIRRDFWRIMEYAKKKDFAIYLNSNGSLITKDVAKRLADLFLFGVRVSMYAIDEQTYKSITGVSGVFNNILRNIDLLVRYNVRVVFRTPLLDKNIHQITAIDNYAKKLGIELKLLDVHASFDGSGASLNHLPSVTQITAFYRSCPKFCEPEIKEVPSPDIRFCQGVIDGLSIGSHGEVMPCVTLRNKSNIREKTIAEIIKTDPLFTDVCNNLRWKDAPQCLQCKACIYCHPCPGTLFLETGSYTKPALLSACKPAWIRKKIHEERNANDPGAV